MRNIFFLMFFLTTTFFSFSQEIRGVVTTNVNVRWEASTKSKIIKVFNKGKEVIVLQTKGSWSFVKDPVNNKKGWVSSRFIQTNISFITQNANVRNTPNGRILKQIPKGRKVKILQEKKPWCFIQDLSNNKKGWVHQSLLSSKNKTTSSPSNINHSTNSSSSENASIQIIEERMRNMGLYNKWVQFNRNMPSRYYISNINTFVNTVESYMGVRYARGGTSRSGVDCSGLVYVGLKSVGYNGERLNAERLAKLGRFIAYTTSLKRGDLVFFKTGSWISHVGVYTGGGKFVHAPRPGKVVAEAEVNDIYYWKDVFLFGVRLTK